MKTSVCALISGGLDSCVMLAGLDRHYDKVIPVYVRQGLVWEKAELLHLRRFLHATALPHVQRLVILNLSARELYGKHWSTTGQKPPGARTRNKAVYLPGRNLLLLSKAAVLCAQQQIPVIAIGLLRHNPFPDATPQFFHAFGRAASEACDWQVEIVTPFRSISKETVIRRGRALPLHLSFSCLAPRRGLHCGRCNKCAERRRAFIIASVSDRTKYAT